MSALDAADTIYLADVNVLLALLWPRHTHHSAAQKWFAVEGQRGWATNTITQIGVVRLLTNPAIACGAINASTALGALAEATRHPSHRFWPLDRPATLMLAQAAAGLTGYRQWTDLLLLQQAIERQGRLVTFDEGMISLSGKSNAHLLVLHA